MRRSIVAVVLLSSTMTAAASARSPEPAREVARPDRSEPAPAVGPAPVVLKPQERVGLLRSSAGLRLTRLVNGATMVDAQGRFREFVVVSIDAQGRPRVGCTHSERALRLVLEGRAQAAPARFEER
jgi:hypothetical protein